MEGKKLGASMVVGDELVTELRHALEREEIEAGFQPQVDLRTGKMVAAEALCRWHHPHLGVIPPVDFIPLAEKVGLIGEVGRFMVEASCAAAVRWWPLGVSVSVNVSPTQLAATDFAEHLVATTQHLSLDPQAITLEITESVRIVDLAFVLTQLEALRALGMGISIDDYGSGFSSLAQLNNLPATELKLDGHLVQDESVENRNLVVSIIELVHSRGLRVVAEGVETREQFGRVVGLGCDRAQGFYIAKPMSGMRLEMLLS